MEKIIKYYKDIGFMGYAQKVIRKRRTIKRGIVNVSLFIILNVLIFFLTIILAYHNSSRIVNSLFSELRTQPKMLLNFINKYGNNSLRKIQSQLDTNNISCQNFINNSENKSIVIRFSGDNNKTNDAIFSDVSKWCSMKQEKGAVPDRTKVNFTDVMLTTNLTDVLFGQNSTNVAESERAMKSQFRNQLGIINTNDSPVSYETIIIILIVALILVYAYNNGLIGFLNKFGDSLFSYSILFIILILIMPWLERVVLTSHACASQITGFFLILYLLAEIVSPYFAVFAVVAIIGVILMILSEIMAKKILVKDFEDKNIFKAIKNGR